MLRALLVGGLVLASLSAFSEESKVIHERLADTRQMDGLFPIAWSGHEGRLYLQVRNFDQDFLFLNFLPYGLGSNDIGLDRGKLGASRIVHFSRIGGKVLLIAPNLQYRASSSNPYETLAVKQSFAESVLAGFKIEAEENGAVLIDVTSFFQQDLFGVAEQLKASKQGDYKIDPARSAITLDNTKNFPLNTEVESILTFSSDSPVDQSLVATVTPDAHSVTLREHYSFIQLPGPGYMPRAFDPRAGFGAIQYRDYSAPLGSPNDLRFIARHRLEKKNPEATVSEPVKPIVYYIDRGAPEPIRSALVEGASWWNQAFEAAGFKNAFHVEVLPEGADPMDVRYNMVQWVHRSTRGWSYGDAVVDPRTGEIIKGLVTLGSLRARQDYMIAEALLSPYEKPGQPSPEMQAMVLARLRQLAAHEVGHTLGLEHNFAASAIEPGASVMDYPHPWVTLDAKGRPDLSKAYATGIGAWDKVAIQYGYSQVKAGTDEHAALDGILTGAQKKGIYFITDQDARPLGGAHPHAHLWDNGADPAVELERLMKVRAAALARFGENAIPVGTPMAQLEDTLVPLYLLHRYQTEAAAKQIGGLDYRYAVRGDGEVVAEIVPAAEQKKALEAVLKTLSPEALTLPEPLLRLLPPRALGYPRTRESFPAQTGLTFDPLAAAEAAANLSLKLLFDPERASRLVEYSARDAGNPSLEFVIDEVLKATWKAPRLAGFRGATQDVVDHAVLEELLGLAAGSGSAGALARGQALALRGWLKGIDGASAAAAVARIDAFEKSPEKFVVVTVPAAPPGQPIGDVE
jgi:Met-zincin/Domain of unknown function (DUF5117)